MVKRSAIIFSLNNSLCQMDGSPPVLARHAPQIFCLDFILASCDKYLYESIKLMHGNLNKFRFNSTSWIMRLDHIYINFIFSFLSNQKWPFSPGLCNYSEDKSVEGVDHQSIFCLRDQNFLYNLSITSHRLQCL